MIIIADENIPYVREAFAEFGEVRTVAGRAVTRDHLLDAEMLLVRSITKVDAALLEGTPVRFVATATIGEDHIDKAWLARQGLGFASAPGCNANSVGDYVVAALLELAERYELDLATMILGIVGVGNVGKRVHAKAEALGIRCVLHDPPLAKATGEGKYRPLQEILQCDIVTFHVPLTKGGPHATRHLVDESFLAGLKPGVILMNTSRGAVIDNAALDAALESAHVRAAVMDVWEGEPVPRESLLRKTFIATPHIAGYSFDGKVNGTQQIYAAACRHFGREETWDPAPLLPVPEVPEITLYNSGYAAIRGAVSAVYDIMADDARLRESLQLPMEERGVHFDLLRKNYPRRREFQNTTVRLQMKDDATASMLRGIGFKVFPR